MDININFCEWKESIAVAHFWVNGLLQGWPQHHPTTHAPICQCSDRQTFPLHLRSAMCPSCDTLNKIESLQGKNGHQLKQWNTTFRAPYLKKLFKLLRQKYCFKYFEKSIWVRSGEENGSSEEALPSQCNNLLPQPGRLQPGGYGGVSDDNVDIGRAGYLLA